MNWCQRGMSDSLIHVRIWSLWTSLMGYVQGEPQRPVLQLSFVVAIQRND